MSSYQVRKLPFTGIARLADVLAGLQEQGKGRVVVRVVDGAFEEIHRALELAAYRDPQKQVRERKKKGKR
jgi:hypothetical protein